MNKKQLIDTVAEKLGVTKKEAALSVETVINTIADEMADGGKVSLVGFGVFESVFRNARKCRNLQTEEDMTVPAKMAPKFRASKTLKLRVAELPVD